MPPRYLNQPSRPTQPPILSGMGTKYRPNSGDALPLENDVRISVVAPHHGAETSSIDLEQRNDVTFTLCMKLVKLYSFMLDLITYVVFGIRHFYCKSFFLNLYKTFTIAQTFIVTQEDTF